MVGQVILLLHVDESGAVANITVESGHPILVGSGLLDVVKRLTFEPPLRDGEPLSVVARVSFGFIQTPANDWTIDAPKAGDSLPATPEPDSTHLVQLTRVEPVLPVNPDGSVVPGVVKVKLHVSTAGLVESAEVIPGAGPPTNPRVAAAALEAVKQWTFAPYYRNGRAVNVNTTQLVKVGDLTGGGLIRPTTPTTTSVAPATVDLEVVATRKPYYDPTASQARIQGDVVIELTVSALGNVTGSRIVRGHPMLANGLPELTRKWKFKPPMLNGQPVAATVQIPIHYAPPDQITYPQPGVHLTGSPSSEETAPATPTSVQAKEEDKIISGVQVMPIHQVQPEVPAGVDVKKNHGTVTIAVVVGVDGSVLEAKPVSGPAAFYDVCVTAAKQWKFQPYVYKGRTERVNTEVTFTFELE